MRRICMVFSSPRRIYGRARSIRSSYNEWLQGNNNNKEKHFLHTFFASLLYFIISFESY